MTLPSYHKVKISYLAFKIKKLGLDRGSFVSYCLTIIEVDTSCSAQAFLGYALEGAMFLTCALYNWQLGIWVQFWIFNPPVHKRLPSTGLRKLAAALSLRR